MNTHPQYTTIDKPAPLDHTWDVTFPRHIKQALKKTPAVIRGIPGCYVYLTSDIARVHPVRQPCSIGSGELLDAPVAYLLQAGADIACDAVDLAAQLPVVVSNWLDEHRAGEIDAWLSMLLAEVRMHQAQSVLGNVPRPHSPASEMALRIILECAATFLDVLYDEHNEDIREEFETLGGNLYYENTLLLLTELLFTNRDLLMLYQTSELTFDKNESLHPANWFRSTDPAENPWLEKPARRTR